MVWKNNIVKRTKSILTIFLGIPLTIISLSFLFLVIFSGRNVFIQQLTNLKFPPFLLSIVFFMIFFFLRSIVWKQILGKLGSELKLEDVVYFSSLTELKRYIPGSIFSYVGRLFHFGQLGVKKKIIIKGTVLEASLHILSSFIISISGIIYLYQLSRQNILFQFMPQGIYSVGLYIFITICLFLLFIFLKKNLRNIFKFTDEFFISILSWICYAIASVLIVVSISGFNPYTIVSLGSFFVLAWLIGYLSIITPSGVGVREAVIVFGLSYIVPIQTAVAVALLARIVFVFSEFIFFVFSSLFYKWKGFLKKKLLSYSTQSILLFISIFTYISYFSYVTFEKHLNFFTGRFDLGNMDQTVWNTIHGRLFQLTNPDGINSISRLGIHADFILVLLSPIYLLWQDPRMLLFAQTVFIALGGYFIYKIGQFVMKNNSLAFIFSLSYLLNPFVQKQNLYDFHAVTLATTFLAASFYYILIKKWKMFLLFITLAVLTKENVFITSSLLGIYLFRTKRKLGVIVALLSISAFYTLVTYFIPNARGGQHFALEYFQEFGDTPFMIIKNIFFTPNKTIAAIFTYPNFQYIFTLFFPAGFLSFIQPLALIFCLPDLTINLLSKNTNFKSITFHYAATIIPFIYISSIYGVQKLLKSKLFSEKLILYYIIFSSVLSAYFLGPLPGAKSPSLEIFANKVNESQEIRDYLKKIPPVLSISATNNLGAHISHREKIFTIPQGIREADMILFLLNDKFAQPSLEAQEELAEQLKNNNSYIQEFKIGDFIAFKRSTFRLQ
ncbi:MAG: hypothetical protein COX79_03250 [Candidatus Levybacteria bacterium CG_4_10_14_0_2_um_filter_36_16]|nr:MAG: hypothetical protein AUK12_05260 [Candidatus Levybacteria bacterium CG2_30_37_29]PIZ97180.1 MAG: hypothetical protein COX79_03250 [Candidatus Levybacteria bacterium CG_4_10_14_0_2_um_filter_36_16]